MRVEGKSARYQRVFHVADFTPPKPCARGLPGADHVIRTWTTQDQR